VVVTVISDYFLKSINQLIFVMVKCGVLFQVRTEFKYDLDELWLQMDLDIAVLPVNKKSIKPLLNVNLHIFVEKYIWQ
jgi:hypothetical protein